MSPRVRLPALGPRGEGWVALQIIALLGVAAAGLLGPSWDRSTALRTGGLVVFALGVVFALAGVRGLGPSMSAFPRPHEGAVLRERGVYRLVRHPIYGGLIVACFGWSLTTSPLALVPTLGLAAVFEGKRRHEERWLVERFPGYAAYALRVRHRFVPYVW